MASDDADHFDGHEDDPATPEQELERAARLRAEGVPERSVINTLIEGDPEEMRAVAREFERFSGRMRAIGEALEGLDEADSADRLAGLYALRRDAEADRVDLLRLRRRAQAALPSATHEALLGLFHRYVSSLSELGADLDKEIARVRRGRGESGSGTNPLLRPPRDE